MRPLLAADAEARREHVVRAQRREAIRLHPPATLGHLRDRGLEVVIAHDVEHAAEPLKRVDVTLEERLLGLALERHHEPGAREARPHHEQMHDRLDTAQPDRRLAPVDLRFHTRLRHQRHERLADLPKLTPAPMHVARDLTLGHDRVMLGNQPLQTLRAV